MANLTFQRLKRDMNHLNHHMEHQPWGSGSEDLLEDTGEGGRDEDTEELAEFTFVLCWWLSGVGEPLFISCLTIAPFFPFKNNFRSFYFIRKEWDAK